MKPRVEFVPHYMAVSPSPLKLFERLSADEQVAIDLILHACNDDDVRLRALVPAEGRRGYLRTLSMQLPSCKADGALDADVAMWAAARDGDGDGEEDDGTNGDDATDDGDDGDDATGDGDGDGARDAPDPRW
jgi:hypothetical protein